MVLPGIAFALIGLFIVGAAALDWNYFMTHPKARPLTMLFGRNGTRVVYGLLGVAFIAMGIAAAIGLIGPPPVPGP